MVLRRRDESSLPEPTNHLPYEQRRSFTKSPRRRKCTADQQWNSLHSRLSWKKRDRRMWNTVTHDVRDHAHQERISSKLKGTSGLALPLAQEPTTRGQMLCSGRNDYPKRGLTLSGKTPPKGQSPFRIAKLFKGIVQSDNSTIGGDQSESCVDNATTTAFDIQIHRSRWVDSPESADLIGKINIVGTAIVADVTEG